MSDLSTAATFQAGVGLAEDVGVAVALQGPPPAVAACESYRAARMLHQSLVDLLREEEGLGERDGAAAGEEVAGGGGMN